MTAADRPSFDPIVTMVLIALNVTVFVVGATTGEARVFELGANAGSQTLTHHELWRLGSSMFIHAGVLHLGMNMLALYQGGPMIERLYGRAGLVAIFVGGGLVGSLASAVRGTGVSVGASGAILGLFGAYGSFLARHRKQLDPVATSNALRGLAMMAGLNVLLGLSVPNIDQAAHVGGILGGVAVGWLFERTPRSWRVPRRALVAGGAVVAVVLGAALVVKPLGSPLDRYPVVVKEFLAVEHEVVDGLNALRGSPAARTPAELADGYDRLVARWAAARAELEQAGLDERWSKLRRYAKAREDAFRAMAAAARADDGEAFQRGQAASQAALDDYNRSVR
ncbi:MAG: rhomboid family intramembrane serine protease [Kofleriaceae bacterium]